MRVLPHVLVLTFLIGGTAQTLGAGPMNIPLEVEIFNASHIVRAKIEAREFALVGFPTNPLARCGHEYTASIIESFKGADDAVTFISDEALTVGQEYLLFIHPASDVIRDHLDSLSDLLPPGEALRTRCRLSAEHFLPITRTTFMAFDSEASEMFGGEWIKFPRTDDPAGFTWCKSADAPRAFLELRDKVVNTFEDPDTGEEFELGAPYSTVLKWESAKTLLLRGTENPPYWFEVVPNPFFVPGTC